MAAAQPPTQTTTAYDGDFTEEEQSWNLKPFGFLKCLNSLAWSTIVAEDGKKKTKGKKACASFRFFALLRIRFKSKTKLSMCRSLPGRFARLIQ